MKVSCSVKFRKAGKFGMLSPREYLPIGSVVLLKNGIKKAMIIGIMPIITDKNGEQKSFDYTGVLYPEGLLSMEASFVFNHIQIMDVVFRGYENLEREEFISHIEQSMKENKN